MIGTPNVGAIIAQTVASPNFCVGAWLLWAELEAFGVLEEADAQVFGEVDILAVDGDAAVGNTHHQFALDDALQADVVADLLGSGEYLAGEFEFA